MPRLADHLCFSVYALAHAFNRAYKPLLDKVGLTYPQYLVLLTLFEEGKLTVKAIGERLSLDSGTLSPLLKRLDAAGLVTRLRDARDERQVLIQLTEKGERLRPDIGAIHQAIGAAVGCSLSDTEALQRQLRDLTTQLGAAAPSIS
ncbi:MarR family transcriptional regulator [Xaviernesmea oryzae]|uniref:MarR family transcriptional regulator n=1 Tax=Xaviernesmea oryzae TaxID=464029 RepID=A0A1Q9B320_9HYPH|nr:MarR family transcriptional regulator [Xaviernesmea oryzae]OLP62415.1 MarR family transcriptional regulator [Xaviernesmea oryzae]SEM15664.1 DNA-binding transcriptional regulator, MarR family [Xaviernesmea oryzae]